METEKTTSTSPANTGAAAQLRRDRIWKRAYEARTRDDLVALYDEWATSYDDDHEAIGFFGHALAADLLARYVPFRHIARVLDAGAGTGAAGRELARLGYDDLTALDLSPGMLEVARATGHYRSLRVADLAEPLDDYPCNHFDAAILVGVFSYGQAPAHALDEIVRVVKPGGVVAFTMRVDFFEEDAMGVRSRVEELDRSQAWKQLAVTPPHQYLPGKDPDAMFRVWCYRVLETKLPPVDEEFAAEVHRALMEPGPVKCIDHSFIWNSVGSRLYERYTEQPGYYLTRAELNILESHAPEIVGGSRSIVELGCGSATKIEVLLNDATRADGDASEPVAYTPIDVSQGALRETESAIEKSYGTRVCVTPRCGRFDEMLATVPVRDDKLIVFFGGSIGNLDTLGDTVEFLRRIRDRMTSTDRFIVGVDLDKDPDALRGAYEAGPANRSFFLNMIRRMNVELGANFDLSAFEQESPYLADEPHEGIRTSSVRFRLVSRRRQSVYLASLHMEFDLDEGDAIQVGISRKFETEAIRRVGALAGLALRRQWLDSSKYFSLNEFVRSED